MKYTIHGCYGIMMLQLMTRTPSLNLLPAPSNGWCLATLRNGLLTPPIHLAPLVDGPDVFFFPENEHSENPFLNVRELIRRIPCLSTLKNIHITLMEGGGFGWGNELMGKFPWKLLKYWHHKIPFKWGNFIRKRFNLGTQDFGYTP